MGGWIGSILDDRKFDYKGGNGYNGDWWWYCRVRQGTWETKIVAGFAPGWSETGCLCGKYRGALQRIT